MRALEIFLHSRTVVAKRRNLVTARPEDITEFLAFKDVSGVGRTVVHDIFKLHHDWRTIYLCTV